MRWGERCVKGSRVRVGVIEVLFGGAQNLAKEFDEDAHDEVRVWVSSGVSPSLYIGVVVGVMERSLSQTS